MQQRCFDEIFEMLRDIEYYGYIAARTLPEPEAEQAADRAASCLLRKLNRGPKLKAMPKGLEEAGSVQ